MFPKPPSFDVLLLLELDFSGGRIVSSHFGYRAKPRRQIMQCSALIPA